MSRAAITARHAVALASLAASASCAPDLNVRASRVVQTRVVAVRATPAEARPGDTVSWEAIVVSPLPTPAPTTAWAMCLRPRSAADSITVTGACLQAPDTNPAAVVVALPTTAPFQAQATIPSDACSKIGPDVPRTSATGEQQRPPDADITGGYQLPIRVALTDQTGTDISFDRQRVRCNLASAPAAAARDYDARYKTNENPAIIGLKLGDTVTTPEGATFVAQGAAQVTMVVGWDPSSQETYVLFDPVQRAVVERRENLEIAWYTNGGEFEHDRTTPDDGQPLSTNVLKLDAGRTGPVTVWVVLRDDRGGVGTASTTILPG